MEKMHILDLQLFVLHSESLGKTGRGPFPSPQWGPWETAAACGCSVRGEGVRLDHKIELGYRKRLWIILHNH